ncbi:MAG: DNA glycosylase AlkZ-like family protein, partial [Phycisphaerales bacterium]
RAALDERGPLASRDFPRPPRASEGWWDWSPHKAALEYLWRAGEVAVHSRRGFEKLYDLAERVHGPMPAPPAREELVAWACRAAIERLGAGTPREFAQFMHAVTVEEARAWCAGAVARGEVEAVLLERIGRTPVAGYARQHWKRDAEAIEPDPTPRLLAPFDPLIRDRARLLGLFSFDYRFEAFVPAARRVHGYYTMPVLAGERLVARVDLSRARAEGVLRVARTWSEPRVTLPAAKRATRAACERLAAQLGLALEFAGQRDQR